MPQVCKALAPGSTVLLQAPPGAGKTTRVPLALLGALESIPPLQGRILMLEPRRLAAKAAASRLTTNLNEPLGNRVGYSVRHEQCRSRNTQLEVITDGLFLRRLQADPALGGVACVIFDEFHERRRDSDLALAMIREARPLLHPELRLLLMSATLNLRELQSQLPEATLLSCRGKAFPVSTTHQPPKREESLPKQILRALENHAIPLSGNKASESNPPSVLVFLPGIREIQRTNDCLQDASSLRDWQITTLHGQQSLSDQSQALQPCSIDWQGKIVLASSIAESSLTIDGVSLVIDSGLSRQSRFDPNTCMEKLETVLSSIDSADQRRGRAGRQGPGQCVRLWSLAEQQRRAPYASPELLRADPQPMVLELAAWGAGLGKQLPWLDPPPTAVLKEGQRQLIQLNALDPQGRLTNRGRNLSRLGVHPRLGILLLQAKAWGCEALGANLAALLSDRDPMNTQEVGCDLWLRLELLEKAKSTIDPTMQARLKPIRRLSHQLLRQLKIEPSTEGFTSKNKADLTDESLAALLISKAFPEWLALKRTDQEGSYRLRQGRGASLPKHDPLQGSAALAVARVDLGEANTVIRLALPLSMKHVEELCRKEGRWSEDIGWDRQRLQIRAERLFHLGELLITRESLAKPSAEACRDLLFNVLRQQGLEELPWSTRSHQLRCRLNLAHQELGPPWPSRDREELAQTPESWLQLALLGCMSLKALNEQSLIEALWGDLAWEQRQQLDQLLPERVTIPSGRSADLIYEDGDITLSVKLQEMFGCRQGPSLLHGRLPVTIELLSPAGRPLQRTRDLEGFWAGSYRDVCREMRGRYPKHPWPDDPIAAKATARTKKHLSAADGKSKPIP